MQLYFICKSTAKLNKSGILNVSTQWVDDDLDTLINVIEKVLSTADLLLISGGVSVGDYDFVSAALNKAGAEKLFHNVKQKPGKPLYFGKKGKQLIFGLPGNPSSVLSCYYNYVLPSLKLLSKKENSIREIQAKLTNDYKKPAGLTHFLKGTYTAGKVTPLNAQESFRLRSFAQANCLICLAENQTEFNIGDQVTVLLIPN